VLSALLGDGDFHAVIVAGASPDSPANRVDSNDHAWFAGVGSLQISARRGTYICTGTAIDATHVLTAGHCIDINNDGRSNSKDGILGITFNVNNDLDSPDQVDLKFAAATWTTHPDFTGFARPSVNDDLAVITLAGAGLPNTVPTYALPSSTNPDPMAIGQTELVMVGYGRSGDGINGYTTNASFTTKRVGGNVVDAFYAQDDTGKPASNEVFRFDFDKDDGTNGPMGGKSLGNSVETTLGGGDSGGPSFVLLPGKDGTTADSYMLVGVNTFTQGTNAPKFGSLGGGINVFPYVGWITTGVVSTAGDGGGKGRGGAGQLGSNFSAIDAEMFAGSQGGSNSGLDALAEPPGYAGASVPVGSPGSHSGTTLVAEQNRHQADWFAEHATARTATRKRDLVDTALAANGIANEGETSDDLAPAVDEVLSRWSS